MTILLVAFIYLMYGFGYALGFEGERGLAGFILALVAWPFFKGYSDGKHDCEGLEG